MKRSFELMAAAPGSSALGHLALPVDPREARLPSVLRGLLMNIPSDNLIRNVRIESVDSDDVRDTLAGDGTAYERIVRRHQEPIAAYMWRFTRDLRERDELVQDVFVEAYLSLKTYAGRAPLLHWLKRLATRVGYRFWKSRRARRELRMPDEASRTLATSDDADAWHAAELVHYLLAQLRPRDRLVMTLVYLEGSSIRQTAELTGWSQSMVKVQAHRARHRLARICQEIGVEL